MRAPWETWRKLMVAGAVLLLINSIFRARSMVLDTDLAYVLANGFGYGLLASGFALRMRQRSRAKRESAAATEQTEQTDTQTVIEETTPEAEPDEGTRSKGF